MSRKPAFHKRMHAVGIIIGVLAASVAWGAPGKDEVKTYVLPIAVEGAVMPSPLYISLRVRYFGGPVSKVLRGPNTSSAERALVQLLAAINAGDRKAFFNLVKVVVHSIPK